MRVGLNELSQTKWNTDNAEALRYAYQLTPEDVVFDIGSYRGEWSEETYNLSGCRIIGIEPTPHNAFGHFERFINKAASVLDGVIQFGGAYYYTSAHENPTDTYPCCDINSLLAEYPKIALCKINIEGSEYEILPHIIRAGLHERIDSLQIQFHEIEGQDWQSEYDAIAADLSRTHHLTWRYEFCWENWKRNA